MQADEQKKCDEFNELLEQATKHQNEDLREVLLTQYPGAEFDEPDHFLEPVAPMATSKEMENEAVRQALSTTGGFMVDPDPCKAKVEEELVSNEEWLRSVIASLLVVLAVVSYDDNVVDSFRV